MPQIVDKCSRCGSRSHARIEKKRKECPRWTVTPKEERKCTYSNCADPATHFIGACYMVMWRCRRCYNRGHGQKECRSKTSLQWLEEFEDAARHHTYGGARHIDSAYGYFPIYDEEKDIPNQPNYAELLAMPYHQAWAEAMIYSRDRGFEESKIRSLLGCIRSKEEQAKEDERQKEYQSGLFVNE